MRKPAALLVLSMLSLLQLALMVGSAIGDSATADEGAHIAAGWLKIVDGRIDFYREQQPFMNAMSAFPLVLASYEFPFPPLDETNHWAVGNRFLFHSGHDSQRILVLARLPTMVLFAALAWLAYAVVARESGDRRWGVIAFALVAFCPNLIAHGRLATVDMAATFFSFLSAVLLVRVLEKPTLPLAIGLGVSTAAAILSKTSAMILLPYGALIILAAFASKKINSARATAAALVAAAGAAILTIELIVLPLSGGGYIGRHFPHIDTPLERLALPFLELRTNVELIRLWYSGTHFKLQYLLGEFSQNSWWYYYPVALFLKMTIPSLLIAVAGVVLLARRKATFGAVSLLLFAAVFLAVAMSGDLALGVRYVLPILPFLYAGSAIVLGRTAGRKTMVAVALLTTWHAGEAVYAYPRYIGYFNQTIGNHRRADLYLIDSNLDWGQDLRRLDRWCRDNGIRQIALCYFGGGDHVGDMNIPVERIWSLGQPDVPRGLHFAISRHFYRISFWPVVSSRNWADYLAERNARYVTTVGDSILVYEIPP